MNDDHQDNQPLILFDGICNLCNGVVRFLMTRDPHKQLRFAAMQSESGQALLHYYGLPLTDYRSFVLIDQGQIYIKSTGFLRLCRYLRFPWPWLAVLRLIPRRFRDWIYDLVVRHRYRLFGRRSVCMLPGEDLADRFLH